MYRCFRSTQQTRATKASGGPVSLVWLLAKIAGNGVCVLLRTIVGGLGYLEEALKGSLYKIRPPIAQLDSSLSAKFSEHVQQHHAFTLIACRATLASGPEVHILLQTLL